MYSICIFGLINLQRSYGHGKTAVVVAMTIFYCAAVNDALVGIRIFSFLYLFEYAFSALIISMALILVNEFLNLHDKIENMSLWLEKTVTERTRESKIISGLLPICASCKKIRDDKGYWNQIEGYIQENSDAVFSHGICSDCAKKLYPDIELKC